MRPPAETMPAIAGSARHGKPWQARRRRGRSHLAVLEDIADAAVAALNVRPGATLTWCYRAPVQARDARRNFWVSIVPSADIGAFLPAMQLFLRMDSDGALDCGFMVCTPDGDRALAALGLRVERELPEVAARLRKPGRGARWSLGWTKPILGQVQEECDLPDWIAEAAALKRGRKRCMALSRRLPVAARRLAEATADCVSTLESLAGLVDDGPVRAAAPAPQIVLDPALFNAPPADRRGAGRLVTALQATADAVAPGILAVTWDAGSGRVRFAPQGAARADATITAGLVPGPAGAQVLIEAAHRYRVTRFGGRNEVLRMNAARQASKAALARLADEGFEIGHRSALVAEEPNAELREVVVSAAGRIAAADRRETGRQIADLMAALAALMLGEGARVT